jgi:hypothetical protein
MKSRNEKVIRPPSAPVALGNLADFDSEWGGDQSSARDDDARR